MHIYYWGHAGHPKINYGSLFPPAPLRVSWWELTYRAQDDYQNYSYYLTSFFLKKQQHA